MYVDFYANTYGADNYVSSIMFTEGVEFTSGSDITPFYTIKGRFEMGTATSQKKHSIDLIKYKHLFDTETKKIFYINTIDAYGVIRSSLGFTIQLVNLEVKTSKKGIFKVSNDIESYSCEVNGGSSGVYDKKLVFSIYQEDKVENGTIEIPQEFSLNASLDKITSTYDLKTTTLSHGVYTL
jgi:hypothetical protein